MSSDYTENKLIQDSAGNLLHDELGWDVYFAYNKEVLGENGTFGRKSYEEILLVRYFRQALRKLNPWIDVRQITEAETLMKSRLSTASLMQINEEKYSLIRDGQGNEDTQHQLPQAHGYSRLCQRYSSVVR